MNRDIGLYMSGGQNGSSKNTRGVKHRLLLDKAGKTRLTNLWTAWIDYKKAYNSMPHTWILECLKVYKSTGP